MAENDYSIVQLKTNPERKTNKKLRKLKEAVFMEGFLSCDSYDDNEFISNALKDDSTGVEILNKP